jgi:hypothetical protein
MFPFYSSIAFSSRRLQAHDDLQTERREKPSGRLAKMASSSATVAPWFAALVAAALPQPVRRFLHTCRSASLGEQVA